MFNFNVDELLKGIICKMNNFLHKNLFNEVMNNIEAIIQNQVIYLNQFYIIISEIYNEKEFDEFGFIEIDKFKSRLKLMIIYNK